MSAQKKQKFKLGFAKFKPNTEYRDLPATIYTGPEHKDRINFISLFIGDALDYGHLFAYLFRRFGYPNAGWDDYKELTKYDLSTPLSDMVLRITPYVGNHSHIALCFLIDYEAYKTIEAYQQRARTAYRARMLNWIEATTEIPDWMPECIAAANADFYLAATSWREVFGHLCFYAHDLQDDAESRKGGWYKWMKSLEEQYRTIEAHPSPNYRSANHEDWPDEDPLKRYVVAAKAALEDLKRPVRVRDQAINVFGEVKSSATTLKEPLVAGYPSGALGNVAPEEFAELHGLIMRLGKGNAKRGIAKVMASIGTKDPA